MLFPDRREAVGGGAVDVLRARLDRLGIALMGGTPMALATTGTVPSATVLAAMAAVDWRYPLLVVYRTRGEDRWSFVRLLGHDMGEEE